MGTALASSSSGRAEETARWVLTGVLVFGVTMSLAFGRGSSLAFSDVVLRRFPISASERLTARLLMGLLEPLWILLFAATMGLSIGFSMRGHGQAFVGLPTAVLFVAMSYVIASILLSLADFMLQNRRGETFVSAIVFAVLLITGLAVPVLINSSFRPDPAIVDSLLRFTPPGIAAALMTGPTIMTGVADAAALLAWCCVVSSLWWMLQNRPVPSRSRQEIEISWNNGYDKLANVFKRCYAPLTSKALRYHMRCNRVRFNLAITIPLLALMPTVMGKKGGANEILLITLSLFFWGGIASTNAMTLNQFGYDGPGVRRYWLLPVPFVYAIRAASWGSLIVGGSAILPGFTLWVVCSSLSVNLLIALMILSNAVAGLFFFNGLGLWTTLLAPKNVNFSSVTGNDLSYAGNIVLFGGLLFVFGIAFYLIGRTSVEVVLHYWWLSLFFAIIGCSFYWLSMWLVKKIPVDHELLFTSIY